MLPTVWLVPRRHPVSPLDPKEFLVTNFPLGMTVLAIAALGLILGRDIEDFCRVSTCY